MNPKIKIAFLDYSNIFSGAEMSLHSLINYLDPNVFESLIYFRYPQDHQERYADLACEKRYLAQDKKWWMGSDRWKKPIRGSDFLKRLIFGFKLARMAKKEKIDILHINLILKDTFLWALLPRLFRIKVVSHSRSDLMNWIPSFFIQKQCNAIICVSDFVKDKVLTKYHNSPAYTVYDPVDFNYYQDGITKEQALKSLGINPKQRLLSSVGLLSAHKGHDMAIRVFARFAEQFPNHILMIAGGGNDNELKRLKQLAIEKGMGNRVIFTEKQIANIATVYRASDLIFSLTTRGEAFGRVPFEGNACDAVVIAPAKGAAIELIRDNETGFLVDPLNEEAILLKTLYILQHPAEAETIVAQGKSYFSQMLSPEYSAQKVSEIYHTVMKESRK
ncbi:MAG: glycosyltransferase family 4 protein [Sulfuricurvum sp.]|nr:glycosyltransferase family 4 protein [Sulfuricurvum sp.]